MQNLDPQELEKFEKMAKSWWDPNGDFKPIHQLNPTRLQYIQQQANGLTEKKCLMWGVVAVFCLRLWQSKGQ